MADYSQFQQFIERVIKKKKSQGDIPSSLVIGEKVRLVNRLIASHQLLVASFKSFYKQIEAPMSDLRPFYTRLIGRLFTTVSQTRPKAPGRQYASY